MPYKYAENLETQKFGRLWVLQLLPKSEGGNKERPYLCLCDCGGISVVRRCNLIQRVTRSCGCLKLEQRGIFNRVWCVQHNHRKARSYKRWKTALWLKEEKKKDA